MTVLPPSPHELWERAKGNRDVYLALLVEHGHIVPIQPCRTCGQRTRHRHVNGRVVPLDIFGHPRP